jgi:hypothetical protein
VFAGSAIGGDPPGPAFAVARAGSVGVLQGLVFDVGVGVGGETPDSGYLFVHNIWCSCRFTKKGR